MSRRRFSVLAGVLLAWATAGVFLYSGAIKVWDPRTFAEDVANYRMLPPFAVALTAAVLPWCEILAGAALVVPRWRRAGALLAAGMAVMFIIAVVTAMIRGLDISCGCFGAGSHAAGLQTLGLDLLILAATFWIWRWGGADGVRTGAKG